MRPHPERSSRSTTTSSARFRQRRSVPPGAGLCCVRYRQQEQGPGSATDCARRAATADESAARACSTTEKGGERGRIVSRGQRRFCNVLLHELRGRSISQTVTVDVVDATVQAPPPLDAHPARSLGSGSDVTRSASSRHTLCWRSSWSPSSPRSSRSCKARTRPRPTARTRPACSTSTATRSGATAGRARATGSGSNPAWVGTCSCHLSTVRGRPCWSRSPPGSPPASSACCIAS